MKWIKTKINSENHNNLIKLAKNKLLKLNLEIMEKQDMNRSFSYLHANFDQYLLKMTKKDLV